MLKYLKLILLILILVLNIILSIKSEAENISQVHPNLNFACQYFKILYNYDLSAAKFVNESEKINSQKQLIQLFKSQLDFVTSTSDNLLAIKPTLSFNSSFNETLNGLKIQREYLINIISELNKGSSFDKAFLMYNWQFINAKKHIQQGIQEFGSILNTFSNHEQLKIFTTAGLTEEKFYNDFIECQYATKVQDNLN